MNFAMNAVRRSPWLFALLALAVSPSPVWGAGEEQVGNEPLSVANYTAWPGLEPVVNDKARIYYSWVNGNENFYYRGSTGELNAALEAFAASDLEAYEVVLRPGPGKTRSFAGDHQFTFHWHLQIFGGIAAHLTTRDQGDQVWNKHPRLTIYVSDEIDLEKLQVPKKVTLLSITELSARARRGAASKDKTVRGWSAGVLAHFDPHDQENLATIETLLADEDDWVRLNGAGSIALFGADAKRSIPALQACLESKDERLTAAAQQAIETIESADSDQAARSAHADAIKQIQAFIDKNRAE